MNNQNLQLTIGRPATNEGREDREIRVYDLLDQLGVSYYRIDHEETMTMEACREIDAVLDAAICKNLFLTNKSMDRFFLLMIPGEKKFRTSQFSKLVGSSRLSFAPPEYMEKYLDLFPGSASVMGLMNDHAHQVQLAMDEDLLGAEWIGFHPC